jgi:hypothetical protein
MPNDVIDLGFLNAGYMAQPDASEAFGFSYNSSLSAPDAYARDLHTRMKTKMEAENSGQNWSVGRICRWQGEPNSYAYCWVIYHLDGTGGANPTGKEFLFLPPGPRDITSAGVPLFSSPNDIWQTVSSVAMANHFHLGQGGTISMNGAIGIHYHKGGLLGAGFTYDVNEALADFAAPDTNPYTDKNCFMPTFAGNPYPRGMLTGAFGTQLGDYNRACLVFNWEKPFIAMYRSHTANWFPRRNFVIGDIIIPRLSSDIYTAAGYTLSPGNNGGAGGPVEQNTHVTFLDDQGNQLDAVPGSFEGDSGVVFPQNFTYLNQPRADGTWDRERVKVMAKSAVGSATTFDKGYFDPDVTAVQGVSRTQFGTLFDSPAGKSMKVSNWQTLPWADGYPLPFLGWPLNPQRKYDP